MILKPDFKLIANDKDITKVIKENLISINFEDKEGSQSDEISFMVNGIYAKPAFGDSLELWLGFTDKLFKCGKFSVQTSTRDFKALRTEVRATAVNFASPAKIAKRRSWENTSIFGIAKKIADENKLSLKTSGADQPISSVLQDNINDINFIYGVCFDYGFIAKVANNTLIITTKDGKSELNDGAGLTVKNENLPKFNININECESLSITEANRNSYSAVIVQWHDSRDGKDKQIKVGGGEQIYKLNIPEPKSDNEAFKKGEAKLNELQRGGINGSLTTIGREFRAGGKLKIEGVIGLNDIEFSIKSVSHDFNNSAYTINVEFEG